MHTMHPAVKSILQAAGHIHSQYEPAIAMPNTGHEYNQWHCLELVAE